mmetsp:Transcript_1626/g.4354  ORF Transcript_1626/g.4354 Transcript_1626/m.4354 type:complete len:337 (-) Transcript_1626:56-1066(-)
MTIFTVMMTLPIIIWGTPRDVTNLPSESYSSSINFCEHDFRDNRYIAEPANTASNLGCYVPLALLGLLGPSSKAWYGAVNGMHDDGGKMTTRPSWRFAVTYVTLLAIGFGSTALHALLTAEAQGGDELPMLWYCASVAYCVIDIILKSYRKWPDHSHIDLESGWLEWVMFASAGTATAVYVVSRENFIFFYAMFSLYGQVIIFGILVICFLLPWGDCMGGQVRADSFRVNVLMPLAMATGWGTILAMLTWVSEMLFCSSATQDFTMGEVVAPWFWNRAVHPLWHFTSSILAWLLLQVLIAAHGVQNGWGEPQVQWYGAPFVFFGPKRIHLERNKCQ